MSKIDLLVHRIKDVAGENHKLGDSAVKRVVRDTAFFCDLLDGGDPGAFGSIDLCSRIAYHLHERDSRLRERFSDKEWPAFTGVQLDQARVIADAAQSVLDEGDLEQIRQPIKSSPRERVKLDKSGQRVRIDDVWHSIPGERRIELLAVLMDAPPGEWTIGKAIHDRGRLRRTLSRLPRELRAIIDGPRPGVGGYRIKPEYRT